MTVLRAAAFVDRAELQDVRRRQQRVCISLIRQMRTFLAAGDIGSVLERLTLFLENEAIGAALLVIEHGEIQIDAAPEQRH